MKRYWLLFVLLMLMVSACQQPTMEPTVTVTDVPTKTATITLTATVTITSTQTWLPTKTSTPITPTATITPPFWEQYPEGTPVPIQSTLPETSRDDYRMLLEDYSNTTEIFDRFFIDFLPMFNYAVQKNLEWIENPLSIALRITGHPNGDNLYPDEISMYQDNEDHLIVLLLVKRCMDDSVASTEDRIELVKENNYWRVLWFGDRWKCHPWRGHDDWGTELCH